MLLAYIVSFFDYYLQEAKDTWNFFVNIPSSLAQFEELSFILRVVFGLF